MDISYLFLVSIFSYPLQKLCKEYTWAKEFGFLARVQISAFSVMEIRKSARIRCESSAGSCEIPAEDRDDEDL